MYYLSTSLGTSLCTIFSAQIASQFSQVYSNTNFIFEYMNYIKTFQEEVFHNVNLNNLENVLQRNLRADRARECIFTRAFGAKF